MFEEVEVYINNVLLDTSLRTYQFQAYKNLLFYASSEEKATTLRGSLYAEERGKHFFGAIFRLQHGKFVFKMGCSIPYLGFR
jgi:hypothetical protein